MILRCGHRSVEITHPDKVWFADGITKLQVIEYYHRVASYMIPYMKQRPLVMHRFPDGISGTSFYHKEIPDYFPGWIDRATVRKEGGVVHHVVCNNQATLVYVANQACITPHIWLSKVDKLTIPDRMIFDLDPATSDYTPVRHTALLLKDILADLGLISFAMTTGAHGMHVVVPIKRELPFDAVRQCARNIAQHIVDQCSQQVTLEVHKEKRGERLFIDTLRNSYGATGVSPYAVRALPTAPVAMPISWDEVFDATLTAQRYTIATVYRHISTKDSVWQGFFKQARSLPVASEKLSSKRN